MFYDEAPIDIEKLRKDAKSLSNASTRGRLEHFLAGTLPFVDGSRDTLLTSLAGTLVQVWGRSVTVEQWVSILQPSISADPDAEQWAQKFRKNFTKFLEQHPEARETEPWEDELKYFVGRDGENKKLQVVEQNFRVIFDNDPIFAGGRYNIRTNKIELSDAALNAGLKLKPDGEINEMNLLQYFENRYNYRGEKLRPAESFYQYFKQKTFDPVVDYLTKLSWDGKPRVHQWLDHALHVFGPKELMKAYGVISLVGAVARAMQPGAKHDIATIIRGPQGVGKSRLIATLGGAYAGELQGDLHDHDTLLTLQKYWFVELAELTALTGRTANEVKQFISKTSDHFRMRYDRLSTDYPRRCAFFGTSNDDSILSDPTGSRRFAVVTARGNVDVDWVERNRDQLFAEAVHLFQNGTKWFLTPELAKEQAIENAVYEQENPMLEAVSIWMRSLAEGKAKWETLEINAATFARRELLMAEQHMTTSALVKIGQAFAKLGMIRKRDRTGNGVVWTLPKPPEALLAGLRRELAVRGIEFQ